MLATFEATNGHNWRNNAGWKTDADIRDWYGVHVNAKGRVDRLDLQANNLTGGFMMATVLDSTSCVACARSDINQPLGRVMITFSVPEVFGRYLPCVGRANRDHFSVPEVFSQYLPCVVRCRVVAIVLEGTWSPMLYLYQLYFISLTGLCYCRHVCFKAPPQA